jgi:hypothetical protein
MKVLQNPSYWKWDSKKKYQTFALLILFILIIAAAAAAACYAAEAVRWLFLFCSMSLMEGTRNITVKFDLVWRLGALNVVTIMPLPLRFPRLPLQRQLQRCSQGAARVGRLWPVAFHFGLWLCQFGLWLPHWWHCPKTNDKLWKNGSTFQTNCSGETRAHDVWLSKLAMPLTNQTSETQQQHDERKLE